MTFTVTAQAKADEEKRRKNRERERRGEPVTLAHEAAEGAMDACETAGKSYQHLGAAEGPGHPVMPGEISAGDYARSYDQAGHAAPSPGYDAPNGSPLPPYGRGILAPLHAPASPAVLGSGPIADRVAMHRAQIQPPPSLPEGAA